MSAADVGRRVHRLRVMAGLGQVELAERVGIPTGAASMLERGRYSPDEMTLKRLARVLGCSADYLTRDREEPLATRPWLRAYADASQKAISRTEADGITAVEAFGMLNLPRVPDSLLAFDGDLNDGDAIERFASDVRSAAGLDEGDVVTNAIRTAERLGVVVLPMESELGRHLGMSHRIDNVPVLRVARPNESSDAAVPGDRQRFTTAHELGHLTLHHDAPPPDSAQAAAAIERQAHRFAGAFLAPADSLLEDLSGLGGKVTLRNLAQLKETWGVAIKALVVRLGNLGVIDDYQARSLYKQISARRWNKDEPVHVGNERAVWLTKALEQRGNGISELGLDRSHFERWVDWSPVPAPQEERTADVVQLRRA